MSRIFFSALVCLLLANSSSAQPTDFSRYYTSDISTRDYRSDRPYYIVRGISTQKEALKISRSLDNNTAVVKINSQKELDDLKTLFTVNPANDEWKLSSTIEMVTSKPATRAEYNLTLIELESFLYFIQSIADCKIIFIDSPSKSLVLRTSSSTFREKILPRAELVFADLRMEPKTEIGIIGYNRSYHGINAVDYSIPGANGKNIVTGVKEQKMQPLDLDLYKRVLNSSIAAPTISSHATVISSIIGGAGNSFYDGRGIAWGTNFFPSSFSNLFPDDAATLTAARVTIQNHSYGTIIQQFYGAEAVSYDLQTWQNKNLLHVFSVGNQGTSAAPDGRYANIPGFANITGNFKMAKNVITVGAIDNKGVIPAESSSGPIYDGRVAPQLIALGPNGTSDAAGIVSGTIAVMQQVYADSNNQVIPPASLIKAVLYNNADPASKDHIDYKTGYGLLNSFESIRAIQKKEYDGGSISNSQQWTKNINIHANCAQVKVTLAWTDTASSPNNSKALVNDLDLELTEINTGNIFKPWVLSTAAHADSLAKLPVRKRDSLNTAEQVTISLPTAGTWQIKVTGTSVLTSSLPFHIAYHTDTLNSFHFTSPQHTSDVNRDENPDLDIRWRTFVADTNQTGDLYISYDAGNNWQLIKGAHKIYTNYFQWPIKDTSSRAIFKMQTTFGDFFSKEFVIHKVTRLQVDFFCTDSFRLSWQKHLYANSYKLFTLIDSPYLKPIISVADTFVVLNRVQYPNLVYAVEPVLSNGIPAARSIAQEISIQGVKCFYRTFYYTLLDQNKLDLILDLSAANYVDSLIFEQVTSNGTLLRNVGNQKANAAVSIYHQLVNEVPGGTSYWRVKIKLKNGSIVYSEIISVLTSGSKYLVFYPNPSSRTQSQVYILQQGVPLDSRLQLFDMTGRMIKDFAELPGTFSAKGLPVGVVIYKLMSREGNVLEIGKLLIMQ